MPKPRERLTDEQIVSLLEAKKHLMEKTPEIAKLIDAFNEKRPGRWQAYYIPPEVSSFGIVYGWIEPYEKAGRRIEATILRPEWLPDDIYPGQEHVAFFVPTKPERKVFQRDLLASICGIEHLNVVEIGHHGFTPTHRVSVDASYFLPPR